MAEDIFKDKFARAQARQMGGDKLAKPRPTVDLSKYKFADEPAVKSVGRSVAGKLLGAAAGQAAGVLLTPTPAGAGSDKVPAPSKRQMKNVDNSGLTKEPI